MEITRRDFIRTSSAAAAAALAPEALAKDDVERVINETKFIDVHAHCTQFPLPTLNGRRMLCCPDDLLKHYDRIGIEKGVILALCNPENTVGGMSSEEILRLCAQYPERFIPTCALDPRAVPNDAFSPLGDYLKYYRDKGCKVLGEVCANLRFLDPRMQNLFKGCEEAGLPLTFHISPNEGWQYGIVDQPGLPELEICLQRFPKLKFFGHSQTFWCEIGKYDTWDERNGYPKGPVREGRIAELMRRYPNLYCDLSAGSGNNALARDLEYAGRFLSEFQDRIMYGVDICYPDGFISPLHKTLQTLLRTGRITASVYRKVARENQIRLLKI